MCAESIFEENFVNSSDFSNEKIKEAMVFIERSPEIIFSNRASIGGWFKTLLMTPRGVEAFDTLCKKGYFIPRLTHYKLCYLYQSLENSVFFKEKELYPPFLTLLDTIKQRVQAQKLLIDFAHTPMRFGTWSVKTTKKGENWVVYSFISCGNGPDMEYTVNSL